MFVFDLPILRFTSRFALAYEELEIFIAIIWTSEKDVAGEFPQRVQQSVNEGIQIPHEVHFAVLLHLATENAHLGLMIRQIPEELVVLLPYKAELLLPIVPHDFFHAHIYFLPLDFQYFVQYLHVGQAR